MPQYITLPNGGSFPMLEGESPQEALQAALLKYPEAFGFEKPADNVDKKGFVAAASASLSKMKGEGALALGKLGAIDTSTAERINAEQNKKAEARFTPTQDGWTESPWQKLKETAGGSAPYMVAPMIAGAAATAAGVAAPLAAGAAGAASLGQFFGTNLSRQVDEGRSLANASGVDAALAAIPQAALDTLSFRMMPGIGKLFGAVGKPVTEESAKALATQGLKAVVADYAKATGKSMGVEGLTEAAQQVFERLQAGLSIQDPQAQQEYFDNFIGGAALAGVLGPFGRAQERGQIKREGQRLGAERVKAEQQAAQEAAAAAEAQEAAQREQVLNSPFMGPNVLDGPPVPEGGVQPGLFPGINPAPEARADRALRQRAGLQEQLFGMQDQSNQTGPIDPRLQTAMQNTLAAIGETEDAAPPTPEERRAELVQQERTLTGRLKELADANKAVASPEDTSTEQIVRQHEQVLAALAAVKQELETLKVPESPDVKLARKYSAWEKAKQAGDIPLTAKIAAEIRQLKMAGGTTPAQAMTQQSIPLQPFTGYADTQQQFDTRQASAEFGERDEMLRQQRVGPSPVNPMADYTAGQEELGAALQSEQDAENATARQDMAQFRNEPMRPPHVLQTETPVNLGSAVFKPSRSDRETEIEKQAGALAETFVSPKAIAIESKIAALTDTRDAARANGREDLAATAQAQITQLQQKLQVTNAPAQQLATVDKLLAEMEDARRTAARATSNRDSAAVQEAKATEDRIAKQLGALQAEPGNLAGRVARSKNAADTALEDFFDTAQDLHTAGQIPFLRQQLQQTNSRLYDLQHTQATDAGDVSERAAERAKLTQKAQLLETRLASAMPEFTGQKAQARMMQAVQQHVEATVLEERARRKALNQPAPTPAEVQAYAKAVRKHAYEVMMRASAEKNVSEYEDVVVQPAQMRAGKVTRGAVTERRQIPDDRRLEERPYAKFGPAREVEAERFAEARAAFVTSLKPQVDKGPGAGVLKPQWAAKEAAVVADERGENAKTVTGQLRRRAEHIKVLLSNAEGADDFYAAVAQYPTNAVMDIAEPVATRARAGAAPTAQDRADLREALALEQSVAQDTTDQRSLFDDSVATGERARATAGAAAAQEQVKALSKTKDLKGLKSAMGALSQAEARVTDTGPSGTERGDLQRRLTDLNKQITALAAREPTEASARRLDAMRQMRTNIENTLAVRETAYARATPAAFEKAPAVQKGRAAVDAAKQAELDAKAAQEAADAPFRSSPERAALLAKQAAVTEEMGNLPKNGPRAALAEFGKVDLTPPERAPKTIVDKTTGLMLPNPYYDSADERSTHASRLRVHRAMVAFDKFARQFDVVRNPKYAVLREELRAIQEALKTAPSYPAFLQQHMAVLEAELARAQYAEKHAALSRGKLSEAQITQLTKELGEAKVKMYALLEANVDSPALEARIAEMQRTLQGTGTTGKDTPAKRAARERHLAFLSERVQAAHAAYAPLLEKQGALARTHTSTAQDALSAPSTVASRAAQREALDAAKAEQERLEESQRRLAQLPSTRVARDTTGDTYVLLRRALQREAASYEAALASEMNKPRAEQDAEAIAQLREQVNAANKEYDQLYGAVPLRTERSLSDPEAPREVRKTALEPTKEGGDSVAEFDVEAANAEEVSNYRRPSTKAEIAAMIAARKVEDRAIAKGRGTVIRNIAGQKGLSTKRKQVQPTMQQAMKAGNAEVETLENKLANVETLQNGLIPKIEEARAAQKAALKAEKAALKEGNARAARAAEKKAADAAQALTKLDSYQRRLAKAHLTYTMELEALENPNPEVDVEDAQLDVADAVAEARSENDIDAYRGTSGATDTALHDATIDTLHKNDAVGAMEDIAANSRSPVARRVAAAIAPLLEGVRTRMVETMPGDKPDAPGGVSATGRTVWLNTETGMSEETTIHEYAHAATMRLLSAPDVMLTSEQRAAKQELQRMFDRYKGANDVAKQDLKEFVAEGLASRNMQDEMRNTPWQGQRSMWQRFKQWVMQLLGVRAPQGTQLDAFLDSAEKLFSAPAEAAGEAMPAHLREKAPDYGPYDGSPISKEWFPSAAADKRSSFKRFSDAIGAMWNTGFVDMHAPLMDALDAAQNAPGVTAEMITQAKSAVRNAARSISYVTQFMTTGGPEWVVDEKKLRTTRASGAVSGADVLRSAEAIPGVNAEAKFQMLTRYMVAMRALRTGVRVAEDVSAADLQQVLDQVNADPALKAPLEATRALYNKYNEALVRYAEAAGGISPKEAQEYLQHGDYVPMYRRNGNTVEISLGDRRYVSMGDIANTPFIHSLKGGKSQIIPLNESILYNTKLLTDVALTNMAKRSAAYALSAAGKPVGKMKIIPKAAPAGTLEGMFIKWNQKNADGTYGEHYIALDTEGTVMEGVPPEVLMRSIEGFHATMPALVRGFAKLTDVLRAGITRMPAYTFRQLTKDPMSAASTSGLATNPLNAVLRAWKEYGNAMWGDQTAIEVANRHALVQSNIFTGDHDDMVKLSLMLGSGTSPAMYRRFLNYLDKSAHTADAATRIQIYKDGLARGLSEVESELRTMESMNFHKRGAFATIQFANRMLPFFNSGIQAVNVTIKAMQGKMPFEEQLHIRRKFFNNMAMLMLGGMAYTLLMEDDPDYKKLPQKDKMGFIHIPLPGTDTLMKIPYTYAEGGGLAIAAGQALVESMRGDKEAFAVAKAALRYGFSAVPGVGMGMPLPQGVKQFTSAVTNTDLSSWDMRPIVSRKLQARTIDQQYNDNTTWLAKQMGELPLADTLGLSPLKVQYVLDGITGNIFSTVLGAMEMVLPDGDVAKADRRLDQTPGIKPFFQNPKSNDAMSVMYDAAHDADKARDTYNHMRKTGATPAAVREYYKAHEAEIRSAPLAGAFIKQMGVFETYREQIQRRPGLSSDEKKRLLEHLDSRQQAYATQVAARARSLSHVLAP